MRLEGQIDETAYGGLKALLCSAVHRLRRDHFAIDLEHARTHASDPAGVVEGKGREAEAVVFAVAHQSVLTGRERFRAFPAHPLEVEQVPLDVIQHLHQIIARRLLMTIWRR